MELVYECVVLTHTASEEPLHPNHEWSDTAT